jgi:nicotinate-nucleotide adenylyltransferase
MKTKVSILGGSYNPITNGHIEVAKCALENTNNDEVWIMPCYGHLQKNNLINCHVRFAMCLMATENLKHIKAHDYEIFNRLSGSVYELMLKLKNDEDYNNYEFSYIIGMDQANNFHTWREYEKLRNMTKFIIMPRQGFKPNTDWFNNKPHIYLDKHIMDVSSTEIRERTREWWKCNSGEGEIDNKIDSKVFSYIKKYAIYKEW